MSIGSIKKLHINSVTLDPDSKESLTLFGALEIDPSSVGGFGDFSKVRARIIISYNPQTCKTMDYLSQRIQEYKKISSYHPKFSAEITPPQYISFLKADLNINNMAAGCESSMDFLKESSPLSPFSSKTTEIVTMFKDQMVYASDGPLLPIGMAICDAPVEFLISPEAALQMKRGSTGGSSKNQIHLDPIHFKFKNLSLPDVTNLSVYAYVYKLPSGRGSNLQIALSTGMTEVTSDTLMGTKTVWKPASYTNPLMGILAGISATLSAPSKDKLINFNHISNSWMSLKALVKISDRLTPSDNVSSFTVPDSINPLRASSNCFSNFWMTKDSEENRRFAFAFDLASYLAENSLFPYLYKNKSTAIQLLDGTGFMFDDQPSQVWNMNVNRRFIDPASLRAINELGTSGYSTELGPNSDFPLKIIRNVRRLGQVALPDIEPSIGRDIPYNSISFYEGKDQLDKELDPNAYNKGTFRYTADFSIYDASIVFLRNILTDLTHYRNRLEELYRIITSVSYSIPPIYAGDQMARQAVEYYDPRTGYINGNPASIVIPLYVGWDRHQPVGDLYRTNTISGHLDSLLGAYETILQNFAEDSDIAYLQYFRERFGATQLEARYIRELIHNMNIFISLLSRRGSEVFPDDPYGAPPPSSEKIEFEARGLLENRMPLFMGSHSFDHKEEIGKDYGFGLDYIIKEETDQGTHNGLSRVPTGIYESRIGQELGKYFFTGQPGSVLSSTEALQDVAPLLGQAPYRYFTPYIIRIPYREPMIQPVEVRDSVYPLSDYARLFTDVFRHKNSLHPGGLYDPLIIDYDANLGPNGRLYNAVDSLLNEFHQTQINDTPLIKYPPLKVITGNDPVSTDLDIFKFDLELFANGPLAIPSIVGGSRALGTTQRTYLDTVDSSLIGQYDDKKPPYGTSEKQHEKELERPIKLPFAIFGELSVDPELRLAIDYQDKLLNSLKHFANQLGFSNHNLQEIFQDEGGDIPPSIKSMLIMAATNERQSFFDVGLDTVRPTLEDQDPDSPNNSIAVEIFGEGTDLQSTGDPMKIYAKFMAFWMNYKQISVIEYLSGFGSLERMKGLEADLNRANKLKMPFWRPISTSVIGAVRKSRKKVLCRVRNYTLSQYLEELSPYFKKSQGMDLEQRIYNFPIYNRYFFLKDDIEEEDRTEQTQKTTSEDECHSHTYNVDEKGNGWTSEAANPDNPKVNHRHQILNYEVQPAKSHCYPHCEITYGVKGVGPHIHQLLDTSSPSVDNSTMFTVASSGATNQGTGRNY